MQVVASRRTGRCRRAARGEGRRFANAGLRGRRGGEEGGEVANGLTGLLGSVDWIWSGGRVFFGWPLDRGMLTCPADVVIKQSWVGVF